MTAKQNGSIVIVFVDRIETCDARRRHCAVDEPERLWFVIDSIVGLKALYSKLQRPVAIVAEIVQLRFELLGAAAPAVISLAAP